MTTNLKWFEGFAYSCVGFGAVSEFLSKNDTSQMKISAFILLAVAAGLVYGSARMGWKVCAWFFASLVVLNFMVGLLELFASPETLQALGIVPEGWVENTLDTVGVICGLAALYFYFFRARKFA